MTQCKTTLTIIVSLYLFPIAVKTMETEPIVADTIELTAKEYENLTYRDSEGYSKLFFPKEMIDQADNADLVKIDRKEYETLVNESKCNAIEKKAINGQVTVTEKELLNIINGLKYKPGYLPVVPKKYELCIAHKPVYFSDRNLTSIIEDYTYFRALLFKGLIRCSGNETIQNYYRPQYFINREGYINQYYRKFGPRFRQSLHDKVRVDLSGCYDFIKDTKPQIENENALVMEKFSGTLKQIINEEVDTRYAQLRAELTSLKKRKDAEQIEECPICLEEIDEAECQFTSCAHMFHKQCLKDASEKGFKTCPACRTETEMSK